MPGTASTAVDKIDLSALDANSQTNGNQAFKFIGTQAFNGTKGAIRLKKSGKNIIVQGDTDGNKAADFEILLKNVKTSRVTAKDFKL